LIPQAEKLSGGSLYHKVCPLTETDVLAAVFALPARRTDYPANSSIVTATRDGMIKKTLISDIPGPSAQTFTLLRVNEGDVLVSVGMTDGIKKDILLATSTGMGIRFPEDEVRSMGLVAAGVGGMKLAEKDGIVGMEVLPSEGYIFLLASDGKAKRLEHSDVPQQGRYGKGVRLWSLPPQVALAGLGGGKPHHVGTVHFSKGAAKSTRLDAAAVRKRTRRSNLRGQTGRGSNGVDAGMDGRSVRHQGRHGEEEASVETHGGQEARRQIGQQGGQEAAEACDHKIRKGQAEEAGGEEAVRRNACPRPGRDPGQYRPRNYCISRRAAEQMRSVPGRTSCCRVHA
jgi:DNA gyrase/topoisomerase IV subunit A